MEQGDLAEPKVHELKSWPEQFEALRSLAKTFEYRKNDRSFRVGDVLHLREWDPQKDPGPAHLLPEFDRRYTGRHAWRVVVHVLSKGFGLPDGYCVLGVEPLIKKEGET
jgi:hypothetical protein